jgi:ABC-type methionine transport system ATPase subunit
MVGPESFVIEIEKNKVPMLLNEFRQDAGMLAQHLKIMNNRMVLLNPRF